MPLCADQVFLFLPLKRSWRVGLIRAHAINLFGGVLGFVLFLQMPYAYAQAKKTLKHDDVFNLDASYSVVHDDNLFRLSSSADSEAVLNSSTKSDDVSVASLGFNFDKYYSLQHIVLGVSLVDSRYANFDYLDNLAINYDLNWQWSITPKLHGEFVARQTEALNSFVDYGNYGVRSMRTDKDWRAGFDYELDGAWHALANVGRVTRLNSETFVQEGDNTVDGASVGARRVFASGSNFSYLYKQGRGDYFKREIDLAGLYPTQFSEREHEFRFFWPVTGKTNVGGRLAYVSRHHVGSPIRDYDGIVGRVDAQWKATAKSSVTLSADRSIGGYQAVDSSYITTDRLALSPVWRMTEKASLRMQFDIAKRRYAGAPVSTSILPMREDTLRNMSIALDWEPMRNLLLGIQLKSEERKSNRLGLDFDSNMASASAQWSF